MEVEQIFNAFDSLTNYVHLEDKIRIKREEIASITSKRCGNCDLWMKSTCIREKQQGIFCSMSSIACTDFEQDSFSISLQKQREDELATLESKLKEIKTQER